VADDNQGSFVGRDDGRHVAGGDPAAVGGHDGARRRVGRVHILAVDLPLHLGGGVRVGRRARERHVVAGARLGRPRDGHVGRRNWNRAYLTLIIATL